MAGHSPGRYRSPVLRLLPATVKPERPPVLRPLSRPEHPEQLSLESTRPRLPDMDPGLRLSLLLRPVHGRSLPGQYRSHLSPVTGEHPGVLSVSAAPGHSQA